MDEDIKAKFKIPKQKILRILPVTVTIHSPILKALLTSVPSCSLTIYTVIFLQASFQDVVTPGLLILSPL